MSQSPYYTSSRKRSERQISAHARSSQVNQKGQAVILSVLVFLRLGELGFFLGSAPKEGANFLMDWTLCRLSGHSRSRLGSRRRFKGVSASVLLHRMPLPPSAGLRVRIRDSGPDQLLQSGPVRRLVLFLVAPQGPPQQPRLWVRHSTTILNAWSYLQRFPLTNFLGFMGQRSGSGKIPKTAIW